LNLEKREERLPSPQEIDAKIEALKEVLELVQKTLEERIKTLQEAKESLEKAEKLGVISCELPLMKQGRERLYGWLETQLRIQEDKGHIQNLQIKAQGDRMLYSFKIINKDDVQKIERWFDWVRKKL
jgi:hypothetical protein